MGRRIISSKKNFLPGRFNAIRIVGKRGEVVVKGETLRKTPSVLMTRSADVRKKGALCGQKKGGNSLCQKKKSSVAFKGKGDAGERKKAGGESCS